MKTLTNKTLLTALASLVTAGAATAVPITVINGDGEAYGGFADINIGGVAPLATTGWEGTYDVAFGAGAQALTGNLRTPPFTSAVRLSIGSTGSVAQPDGPADPTEVKLFQQTAHTVAEGETFTLDYFASGYFGFNDQGDLDNGNVDQLISFFGYVDGGGALVEVDTRVSTTVAPTGDAVWNADQHSFTVGAGSALIGENLVIGFFTDDTADTGLPIFASVDQVTLDVSGNLVPGDADGDGDVDDTDLGIAISNFTGPGGTGKTLADGDTDGDGDVDDTDLGVAISGFTGPLSPAAVPEPTSLALLGLGGMLIARRRRA